MLQRCVCLLLIAQLLLVQGLSAPHAHSGEADHHAAQPAHFHLPAPARSPRTHEHGHHHGHAHHHPGHSAADEQVPESFPAEEHDADAVYAPDLTPVSPSVQQPEVDFHLPLSCPAAVVVVPDVPGLPCPEVLPPPGRFCQPLYLQTLALLL